MSKRKPAAAKAKSPAPTAARKPDPAFWLACAAIYLYAGVSLWPGTGFAPLVLDDAGLLREFAAKPLSGVFGYDHFGHLRPAKNLLFWLIAQQWIGLATVRGVILILFLATVVAVQRLSTALCGSRAWGLSAAACWALNPIVPGTVLWLSTANHVIGLLGVLFYLELGSRALADHSPRRGFASLGATLALLIALASHQLAALAPLLLLAYRRALGLPSPAASRRRPLVAGSALALLLWFALHLALPAVDREYRFVHPEWQQAVSSLRYLLLNGRLWLWQSGAFGVFFADRPADHLLASMTCWLAAAAGFAAWWRWGRKDPKLTFALQWTLLFLLPVVDLVPLGIAPVASHYLYLPSVGLALLVVRLSQQTIRRLDQARHARWLAVPLPLLLAAWQPQYQHMRRLWGDDVALYAASVANHPTNIEVRVNLVAAYLRRNRYLDADRLLLQSLALAPREPALIRNRFELLYVSGRDEEALAYLDGHSLLSEHDYLVRRGILLVRLQRNADALAAFSHAFDAATEPEGRLIAGHWLASTLVRIGEHAEARALIDRLLQVFPGRHELLSAKRLLSGRRPEPDRAPLR